MINTETLAHIPYQLCQHRVYPITSSILRSVLTPAPAIGER